jgi:hypothetical protein|tara:strand:+ start:163 stop:336 length:174 start_codon:yes stop_codon:yes gene_type:complete
MHSLCLPAALLVDQCDQSHGLTEKTGIGLGLDVGIGLVIGDWEMFVEGTARPRGHWL